MARRIKHYPDLGALMDRLTLQKPEDGELDFSLYLVTDSTEAILGNKDLVDVVERALEGGVSIVQYRDKTSDTRKLINTATRLHEVTERFNVPLIINDRVDVVQAVGAEGLHIGQDDMTLEEARKILGPKAIIGVSCSTPYEAAKAAQEGATYLGIGSIFATSTKKDTKNIIGTAGSRAIHEKLATLRKISIPTVAIGGLNASNIQRVMFQGSAPFPQLSGVAVVSAIMTAVDPKREADKLLRLVRLPPKFYYVEPTTPEGNVNDITGWGGVLEVPGIIHDVNNIKPIAHNITNTVVQNFVANATLAMGAQPIMAPDYAEASDIAKLGGGLVINIGTAQRKDLRNYIGALEAYNLAARPVVLDPVGVGVSDMRKEIVKTLMASGYFHVIKGNEAEIATLLDEEGVSMQQRGVDSAKTERTDVDKAKIAQRLAQRERCIVVMTGEIDIVSDGKRVFRVSSGHPWMAKITGMGCALGSAIAACISLKNDNMILAVLAALAMFNVAGERAVNKPSVSGPGTFQPAFLDALSIIAREASAEQEEWFEKAGIRDFGSPDPLRIS